MPCLYVIKYILVIVVAVIVAVIVRIKVVAIVAISVYNVLYIYVIKNIVVLAAATMNYKNISMSHNPSIIITNHIVWLAVAAVEISSSGEESSDIQYKRRK